VRWIVLAFVMGTAAAAVPLNIVIAYVLHDVDTELIANPARALDGLFAETSLFVMIAGAIFGVAVRIGGAITKTRPASAEWRLCFWLGVGLMFIQYLASVVARKISRVEEAAFNLVLRTTLLAGPVICALVLAWAVRVSSRDNG
jgi:hypothetical protein